MPLPGYLNWPVMKQILWFCSEVLNFIYHEIAPNVGVSIILYAIFSYFLLSPFSIKGVWDKIKARKVRTKMQELKARFMELPEEERKNEEVLEKFKAEEREIKKGKSSRGMGCLMIILKIFVLLASTPVIHYFDHFIGPSSDSWMFLGLDLRAPGPGYSLQPTLIVPFLTVLILVLPGYISTWKNLKERKAIQATKTKEQLEEEAKMLAEMGVKENKIPWAWIIQIFFTFVYFHSFTNIAVITSFFWGVYYAFGFGARRLIDFVITKAVK